MNEWIKCSDRLPTEIGRYIVYGVTECGQCFRNTAVFEVNWIGMEVAFVLSLVFFGIPYVLICFEFPRRSYLDTDPWWLCILKIWGAFIVMLVGMAFFVKTIGIV